MNPRKIREGLYSVGAIDWDRRLFDELIPLPKGTSYNSFLIKGSEATALIDTVDPAKTATLLRNLKSIGVEKLDYVISNHAEQDHSGAIPAVLEAYPEAKVVTNTKCKNMLMEHLLIPEDRFIEKGDGETLSLGDKTLEFIIAPWVHWPETQFTYLREEWILFTCDFLGSHLATSDMYVKDEGEVYPGAKRYYAEIMMPFKHIIPKHLDRIAALDVEIVAPSHGPMYDNPSFILDAYKEWVSPEVKNEVIVAYVTMHGSTGKMAEYLADALIDRGTRVKVYDLTATDIGELAMDLVDAATLVLATPTVLIGPHPSAVYATYLANALKPKLRYATVIGSYGWGGKTVEMVAGMLGNLKVELLEPVMIKGYPTEGDYAALDKLADEIKKKHDEDGNVKI